jgi:hypothetical protein
VSSYYGVIFPEFWTGTTGRQLRAHGKDAQLIGLYLATNRHANMLGLYRLGLDDVRHETGLGTKAIEKGLQAAAQTGYALFDALTEFAWVRQMARFRLGLKAGESLRDGDKRTQAVSRIYHAIEANPFLGDFYDANRKILPLGRRRDSVGLVVPLGAHHKIEPHTRGYGGASPDTDTDTGIRSQEQVQEQQQIDPPTPLSAKGGQPRRYLRADLKEAKRVRSIRFGGCPHEPRCDDHVQCEVLLAIEIAERRKAVGR